MGYFNVPVHPETLAHNLVIGGLVYEDIGWVLGFQVCRW